MISAKLWGKVAARFLDDNAPAVLSGVAVVGAASIGYLTYKAVDKSAEKLADDYEELERTTPGDQPIRQFTRGDIFAKTWQYYIPPAGATVLTIGCIIGSHHISAKRAAALAAAYSVSERAYTEYREKIATKFNPTKEQKIRDEIQQDRVNVNPPSSEMMIVGEGQSVVFDKQTNRYFRSTVERLREVANDVNYEVNEVGVCSLQQFFTYLEQPDTPFCHEIGWTPEARLKLNISSVLHNGQAIVAIDYDCIPLRGL